MEQQESERLRVIWERIVSDLREVVREFEVTEEELHLAGAYFNKLGVSGMFPSLLDSSLAMTSVDVFGAAAGGTRANLEGPFYRPAAPLRPDGNLLDHPPSADAVLATLTGRVSDARTGAPIAGAELDVWQADEHGEYDNAGFHLRGVVRSAADGGYVVHTVVPNDYSQHEHDPIGELFRLMGRHSYRAAHIHLRVRVAGKEVLTTQLFMADSPYLDSDYVIGAVSDDLIVQPKPAPSEGGLPRVTATFDLALPVNTDPHRRGKEAS